MPVQDEVLQVEVEASAGDEAIAVFRDWCRPRSAARLLYTPDVLLAIESVDRRGFLLDEVYWTTIWSDRGSDELLDALGDRLSPGQWKRSPSDERDPLELLRTAIAKGDPLPS